MCRSGTPQSAECHPCTLVAECYPGTSDSLGTLRQWCVKFLPRIFYLFSAPHSRKLWIGLFNRRATKWCFWLACDQNQGSVILMCDHESNFQNFYPKNFGPLRQWSRKFPSRIFYPFLAPTPGNYELVFLTGVRPNSMFRLFDCCATRKGLKGPLLIAGYFCSSFALFHFYF